MTADLVLIATARQRACEEGDRGIIEVSHSGRMIRCRHCGRTWTVTGTHTGPSYGPAGAKRKTSLHGRAAGFVRAAANRHANVCAVATPEERCALMRFDEARWRRNPPAQEIRNQPDHPGYLSAGEISNSGRISPNSGKLSAETGEDLSKSGRKHPRSGKPAWLLFGRSRKKPQIPDGKP